MILSQRKIKQVPKQSACENHLHPEEFFYKNDSICYLECYFSSYCFFNTNYVDHVQKNYSVIGNNGHAIVFRYGPKYSGRSQQ